MNILHVIPGLTSERGGPSTVLEALARHQANQGHSVTVLTTDQGLRHGERAVELPPAVALERLAVRGPDRVAYAPGFARAVRAHLRTADIVHVHSVFTYPVHIALREARAAGVPVILRPCGHLHRYSLRRSAWPKRAYLAMAGRLLRQGCAAWHYTSANERDESWPTWSGGVGPHFVLPNGIEPTDFALERTSARAAVQTAWPDLGGSPYVLFLGRFHPKKRLDLLLEAFLAAAPEPYRLVVAGPDEADLWPHLAEKFLRRPQDAQRVLRVGLVRGRAKLDLLAGASLFALPSEHENFGNAALEALAADTPVLLSPAVDLAAQASSAGLGRIVPLKVSAWSEALASALATPSEPGTARAWALQHFAWDRLAEELADHYRLVSR